MQDVFHVPATVSGIVYSVCAPMSLVHTMHNAKNCTFTACNLSRQTQCVHTITYLFLQCMKKQRVVCTPLHSELATILQIVLFKLMHDH